MARKAKSKKDNEIKELEEKNNILPSALYWEWRASVEELMAERLKVRIAELEQKLSQAEMEKLRLIVDKKTRNSIDKNEKYKKVENDYKEGIVKRVEEHIGHSLENCSIDPITFEVHKLD